MIVFQKEPYSEETIKGLLHPLISEWFFSRFKEFSPPQRFSIVNTHNRENTLISSPTGSGKTLSAFLAILNELTTLSLNNLLEDKIYAVYVSPLKALGNDIQRNLLTPLEELNELSKKHYGKPLNIRVAVRSGDTSQSEKSKMLRKPPHILITTPESLGIVLSSVRFKNFLTGVSWAIIDEIHSLAENKRGVHLSLSLERLHRITGGFCRIGLSATVSPLEEVAKFLVGLEEGKFRSCKIVDVNYLKKLDLKVLSPVKNLIRENYEHIENETYRLIDDLVQTHKTTLIFTNTRSATERVVHHLKERFPTRYAVISEGTNAEAIKDKGLIAAHHGSLSKSHRLWVEEQLKKGLLKVVVSSTSLELGIDIGSIDLVILLGSPKSVARALQRIGRSGHSLHETAKGRIIVQDRDDLVECSVLLKAALEGRIDKVRIPKNALDVLSQHVFGMALEGVISEEELFKTIRNSYCYSDLKRTEFNEVIAYLSGEHASLVDRKVYAKVWSEGGLLGKRGRLARVIYMTNIGTIPDETNVKVKVGPRVIGMISEPFLERLHKGDIFVLGGQTYEFSYAQGLTAFVKPAIGKRPTVPSWFAEMLPLSFDLALEIQRFRGYINSLLSRGASKKEVMSFIDEYLYVDKYSAEAIYEYFVEQHHFSAIPSDKQLVIEHFVDGGDRYTIFHTLFGRRVNEVLARVFSLVTAKLQNQSVQILLNDNGFALKTKNPVLASRVLRLVTSSELRKLAEHSLEKTELLARRFRHCAARSLMILRNYKGSRKSVGRQQLSSRLLLSSVKRSDPNFIILREAKREVLEDLMDIINAKKVIEWLEAGKIKIIEKQLPFPSPFAFNLILTGYSDILRMEDRQEFLRKMHQMVLAKISLSKKAPKEIINKALNKDFDYDTFWSYQELKKEKTYEEETNELLRQLAVAARKTGIDEKTLGELKELIINRNQQEMVELSTETTTFIETLLSGTVPKVWTDDLVKIMQSFINRKV